MVVDRQEMHSCGQKKWPQFAGLHTGALQAREVVYRWSYDLNSLSDNGSDECTSDETPTEMFLHYRPSNVFEYRLLL